MPGQEPIGLGSITSPELIFPELPGADRPTVLRAFAERLAEQGLVKDADELYRSLWEREELGSTVISSGVAVPHCKLAGLDRVVVAIGLSRKGVDFDADDGAPVQLFFLVVSPQESPAGHLRSLAAISKWIKADHHVERILELDDPWSIYELTREEPAG